MHWVVVHYIEGYSLEDWVAILTIISMIIAGLGWLGKRSKKALNNLEHNVLDPIYDELSKLNKNMEASNLHYEQTYKRLELGDKKLIRHDEQLKDHERRIGILEMRDHQ